MKKKKIVLIGILVLLLVGLVILLLVDNKEELTDGENFTLEYTTVTEDNVFVYRDADEIIKIMKNGTGVVYLGFPECPWCQSYVKMLNEVAKEVGIEKIYYYNVLEDRQNNTKEYQEMVSILGDNLEYDDEGNHRIYVPNVSFHINGEIIGNDLETAYDTKGFEKPEEYWTEDETNDLKNRLKDYMEQVFIASNTCTDCNK